MQWMPHALARAVVMLLLVSSQAASASDVPPPKPGSVDSGAPPCPEPNPELQSASSGGGRVDISELLRNSTPHSLPLMLLACCSDILACNTNEL